MQIAALNNSRRSSSDLHRLDDSKSGLVTLHELALSREFRSDYLGMLTRPQKTTLPT